MKSKTERRLDDIEAEMRRYGILLPFIERVRNRTPVVAFKYYRSSTQNLSSGVVTKVSFNIKEFDTTNGQFATTGIFTAKQAGIYLFMASVAIDDIADNNDWQIRLDYASTYIRLDMGTASGSPDNNYGKGGSSVVYLDKDETAEIHAYHNTSGTQIVAAGQTYNSFSGILLYEDPKREFRP